MTASRLGRVSPLFFYGPHGCGKTHLLECLQRDVRGRLRSGRVVYLSAEQFTSLFLEALQGSGLPNFRRKYRDLDLLLIDDVQFFAGKRATLVELHHTIDSLSRTGRQLVFAADRSPIELTGLGPELTARMAGGLVCGMEAIDEPVRREIAARLCRERRFAVPEDVLDLMAARLPGDGRQLRGAVNRLEAMAVASGKAPSLESARETLEDLFGAAAPLVRITDIEEAVCSAFGLERSSLQSDRRSKAISQPRMLAMWLARKYTRAAYAEIGRYFGKRSHSTVISANKKVAQWVSEGVAVSMPNGDYKVRDALRRIESQLRTG